MSEPVTYEIAHDAKPIGEALIKDYHRHLLTTDTPLLYIFRSQHTLSNGRVVFAKAKRVTGMNAFLAYRQLFEEEGDYPPVINVIEIAKDVWFHLQPKQRVALIDHELCHFGDDGTMRGHDVEEFRAVIDRHGLWRPEIQDLAMSISQHKLFGDLQAPGNVRETETSLTAVGLTTEQIGWIRSVAENDALALIKRTLKEKRSPSADERAALGTKSIESISSIQREQLPSAARFYSQEVDRFIDARWDEFNAMKGTAAKKQRKQPQANA